MKRHVIVMEIEQKTVLIDDVDVKEIAEMVSELTGTDESDILISIEVDEEGYVISISIILKEDDNLTVIKNAIDDITDNNKQCDYGVLCRVKTVYIAGEEYTIDGCGRIIIVGHNPVVSYLLIISFMVMIIL